MAVRFPERKGYRSRLTMKISSLCWGRGSTCRDVRKDLARAKPVLQPGNIEPQVPCIQVALPAFVVVVSLLVK